MFNGCTDLFFGARKQILQPSGRRPCGRGSIETMDVESRCYLWSLEDLVETAVKRRFFYVHQSNNMDVSANSGFFSPQIIHFNRVFYYKPSILGVFPLFLETPVLFREDIVRENLPSFWPLPWGWWIIFLVVVVVSHMFIFTVIWGKISYFDEHIFQMGWRHQLESLLLKLTHHFGFSPSESSQIKWQVAWFDLGKKHTATILVSLNQENNFQMLWKTHLSVALVFHPYGWTFNSNVIRHGRWLFDFFHPQSLDLCCEGGCSNWGGSTCHGGR